MNDNTNVTGKLTILLKDKDGNIKDQREVSNLVVDAGLDYMASRMKDATAGVMSHMAVGSDSTAPASGNTDLGSILGAREIIDSTDVSGSAISYACAFEAGEGTGAIREAGIFNSVSGGTMLCRTVFDVINKGASDTLAINWTVTVSA